MSVRSNLIKSVSVVCLASVLMAGAPNKANAALSPGQETAFAIFAATAWSVGAGLGFLAPENWVRLPPGDKYRLITGAGAVLGGFTGQYINNKYLKADPNWTPAGFVRTIVKGGIVSTGTTIGFYIFDGFSHLYNGGGVAKIPDLYTDDAPQTPGHLRRTLAFSADTELASTNVPYKVTKLLNEVHTYSVSYLTDFNKAQDTAALYKNTYDQWVGAGCDKKSTLQCASLTSLKNGQMATIDTYVKSMTKDISIINAKMEKMHNIYETDNSLTKYVDKHYLVAKDKTTLVNLVPYPVKTSDIITWINATPPGGARGLLLSLASKKKASKMTTVNTITNGSAGNLVAFKSAASTSPIIALSGVRNLTPVSYTKIPSAVHR